MLVPMVHAGADGACWCRWCILVPMVHAGADGACWCEPSASVKLGQCIEVCSRREADSSTPPDDPCDRRAMMGRHHREESLRLPRSAPLAAGGVWTV